MTAKKDRDPIVGGTQLSNWRRRFTSADPEERLRVVSDLWNLRKRALKALPVIVDAVNDNDIDVQTCALRALVCLDVDCPDTVGPAAQVAVPALQKLLKNSNKSIRVDAARILGSVGPTAAAAASQMGKVLARSAQVDA